MDEELEELELFRVDVDEVAHADEEEGDEADRKWGVFQCEVHRFIVKEDFYLFTVSIIFNFYLLCYCFNLTVIL